MHPVRAERAGATLSDRQRRNKNRNPPHDAATAGADDVPGEAWRQGRSTRLVAGLHDGTCVMLASVISRVIAFCTRHNLVVIVTALVLGLGSVLYTARHFAIDTDTSRLLSSDLPWR